MIYPKHLPYNKLILAGMLSLAAVTTTPTESVATPGLVSPQLLPADNTEFVDNLYAVFFGREADVNGATFWVSQLDAGAAQPQVVEAFFTSPEFMDFMMPQGRLYWAAIGLSPDTAALTFSAKQIRSGSSLEAVADSYIDSLEFENRFGVTAGSSTEDFVTALYNIILDREPDTDGLQFWVDSGLSKGNLLLAFVDAAEYRDEVDAELEIVLLYYSLYGRTPSAEELASGLAMDQGDLIEDLMQFGTRPLSSMVAVTLDFAGSTRATNIPDYVKSLVNEYATTGTTALGDSFPLQNVTTDTVTTLPGLGSNIVVSWLDPLTEDESADAPYFGANNDYIAYFGDGWDSDWQNGVLGSAPQYNGDGTSGWVWSNHEYMSNSQPSTTSAPTGQHLTLAKFLQEKGVLSNDVESDIWSQADVDTYIRWFKKQLGGSWMHLVQDPDTNDWTVDLGANNLRYDSTSDTLLTVVGYSMARNQIDDDGNQLPTNVAVGLLADCSGGQTPWGTIISAEENSQDYYGDFETAWTSRQQFIPGQGFDAGDTISPTVDGLPTVVASDGGQYGRISDPNGKKDRDAYSFLAEVDVGQPSNATYTSLNDGGDGTGHRKIGSMGRMRWENATIWTDGDFELFDGQPIVIYGANDRRSGRVYKWVSQEPYTADMTKAEVRALLDEGALYVSHMMDLDNRTGYTLFNPDCDPAAIAEGSDTPEQDIADACGLPTEDNRGQGMWIEMSVDNDSQIAPNAAALGDADKTVGAALQDVMWNDIGGFATDNDLLSALFTAANKIGVMEQNRPEDVEWNPNDPSGTPRLYIAFTKNGRQTALNQDGVLFDPDEHAANSPTRFDDVGSIFVFEEADPTNPDESMTFTFWTAWLGTRGDGPFDVVDPDNMAIDADGGVWFGTDGNFGVNGTADAAYYLDLDPAHRAGQPGIVVPTYGVPFRITGGPGDSEATGPAFNSTMTTFFFNVQHPGEDFEDDPSSWPNK